jgi:uncharacterized membrane protein YuzA (DUF378 family)
VKAWLKYTLIRLGVFAVALVALLLLNVQPVLATVIAAVVGLCVAYIFFGKIRAAMVSELAEGRASTRKDADAEAEDANL